ncbi:MAG: hypothetical protein EBR82_45710 [Caulobacteraceae bacterium]|nr:hypothetical protein [Caulobacteraceae bacterium]
MDILHKVLEVMPSKFSSNLFNRTARKMGMEDTNYLQNKTRKFLYLNCKQIDRYFWLKIEYKKSIQFEDEIEKAITLLKSTNNFKIMRRVSDWNEI